MGIILVPAALFAAVFFFMFFKTSKREGHSGDRPFPVGKLVAVVAIVVLIMFAIALSGGGCHGSSVNPSDLPGSYRP